MILSLEQEQDLEDINEAMKANDRFHCPECNGQQRKEYCGRCDNWRYRCEHSSKCSRRYTWGQITCLCEEWGM